MTNDTKKRPAATDEEVRLNVFLQESGVASRRKADELIEAGVVKVNGKSVTQLGTRIRRSDKVHVHGKLLTVRSIPKVIYVLNKPDMCLTTRFDAKGRRTIFDLPSVKNLPPNVQAVGRLDYRSEGLLLLTNDGDLAYALTHPKFSVEKNYAVLVADGVTIEDVEKLRAGVMLDDGLAKAVSVRMGNKERLGASRGQWLELVVTEGRNRLIRRMAEAIGLKVVRLVRVGMGDVLLPATLKPGQAIPVDGSSRNQLEQIKAEMLASVGSHDSGSNDGAPNEAARSKRKLLRQIRLNDEEYEIESSRRSAEASLKRKQRSQKIRISRGEPSAADRPVPRAEQVGTELRDSGSHRSEKREIHKRRSDERGPRPVRRESTRNSDTTPRPVRRESTRNSDTRSRPVRRDDERVPSTRPQRAGGSRPRSREESADRHASSRSDKEKPRSGPRQNRSQGSKSVRSKSSRSAKK